MKFNKQKFFEVLLTALISASIAFLQSLATSHIGIPAEASTPVVAGAVGAGIRALRA
jgi:phosphate/sulfate permease